LTTAVISLTAVITMNDVARYDALLEAGREPPTPCPVCTGDAWEEPCGEDCAAQFERVLLEDTIKRLRARVAELERENARLERECEDLGDTNNELCDRIFELRQQSKGAA
jgi:hypothetical protein